MLASRSRPVAECREHVDPLDRVLSVSLEVPQLIRRFGQPRTGSGRASPSLRLSCP